MSKSRLKSSWNVSSLAELKRVCQENGAKSDEKVSLEKRLLAKGCTNNQVTFSHMAGLNWMTIFSICNWQHNLKTGFYIYFVYFYLILKWIWNICKRKASRRSQYTGKYFCVINAVCIFYPNCWECWNFVNFKIMSHCCSLCCNYAVPYFILLQGIYCWNCEAFGVKVQISSWIKGSVVCPLLDLFLVRHKGTNEIIKAWQKVVIYYFFVLLGNLPAAHLHFLSNIWLENTLE